MASKRLTSKAKKIHDQGPIDRPWEKLSEIDKLVLVDHAKKTEKAK